MHDPVTVTSRARLLQERGEAMTRLAAWRDRADAVDPGALSALLDDIAARESAYLALLPAIALSRCPFSGTPVFRHIDTFGFDGPWWDYSNPIRPTDALPGTWLGMTGSVHFTRPLPVLSHPVMPGPSHPVVLPALLSRPGVRAVLSSLEVGGNPAMVVSLFAQQRHELVPPNEWGAPWCDAWQADGSAMRGPSPFTLMDADTDLAAWMRRGRLLWIAPGDASLLLRSDIAGCPYLRLEGDGRLQYLIGGQVETLGITDADIRREPMTPEAFEAAMRLTEQDELEEESGWMQQP